MTAASAPGDPYDLKRYVEAQRPVFEQVLAELRRGRKESHWMWFVFPQIAGLGRSTTAREFAIGSLDEARAFLAHPVLGPRLRDCTALMLRVEGRSAADILGAVDSAKFRSAMTLFAEADPDEPIFAQAIGRYFDGDPDPLTLERLRSPGVASDGTKP